MLWSLKSKTIDQCLQNVISRRNLLLYNIPHKSGNCWFWIGYFINYKKPRYWGGAIIARGVSLFQQYHLLSLHVFTSLYLI